MLIGKRLKTKAKSRLKTQGGGREDRGTRWMPEDLQGYLVHKKPPPRRTLQLGYARGPMVVVQGYLAHKKQPHPLGPP